MEAVYPEAPAGRETPEEWWDDLVREPVAALSRVGAPSEEDAFRRYAGVPETDTLDAHGRRVLSRLHPVYWDAEHAIEPLEFTDAEREAARTAFRYATVAARRPDAASAKPSIPSTPRDTTPRTTGGPR